MTQAWFRKMKRVDFNLKKEALPEISLRCNHDSLLAERESWAQKEGGQAPLGVLGVIKQQDVLVSLQENFLSAGMILPIPQIFWERQHIAIQPWRGAIVGLKPRGLRFPSVTLSSL